METIAVVGIGCRFPGAEGTDAYWALLRDGVDAVTEVPPDRWDRNAFFDASPAAPGKMNTRWGGFLKQVDQFDPSFFKISPREAAYMDPQQRLLLEVAWESLEDAGQVVERLAGSKTGVFVGIAVMDYMHLQSRDARGIDSYTNTGSAFSIAANRISYVFDFRGPSVAVDTACSSSLVAIHLACQSLLSGESTLALAGGVNVILSPTTSIGFSKLGMLSADGRCKAFDSRANGYVRGEGAAIVVLKPLANAISDGDRIYALIRGSAVNQDGRSNGLTAPSRWSQEAVLKEAYRRAGISPGRVRYVEAHGTGTLLGDPIEAKALGAVVGENRPSGDRCAIGSVKTNIGHLEAAAGVASLIKVALSLHHGAFPPSLHFEEPNPHIPFDELSLEVQRTLRPLADEAGPVVAGVSSFGFGGTNVHVVLEQAAVSGPRPKLAGPPSTSGGLLLPLSAHNAETRRALASSYRDLVANSEIGLDTFLPALCAAASTRRSQHDQRLAVVFRTRQELVEGLDAFLGGHSLPGAVAGTRHPSRRSKLAFVFAGMGSQTFGMGRELMEQEPVFRAALADCDDAIRRHGGWSLLEELAASGATSRLDQIDVLQPAMFAIQVALATLWRSWGIEPDAVVGHSMGEVAAANVAGALALEDAVRVICLRSQVLRRVSGCGGMAVVELAAEEARRWLADHGDRLCVAAHNSPTGTVLSGEPKALEELSRVWPSEGTPLRLVNVDIAFHSPQMDPLCDELRLALDGLQPGPATVPMLSTVTSRMEDGRGLGGAYWARNLRDPVLFSEAVQQLIESGHDTFLEIGPRPVLSTAVNQGLAHAGREGLVLASLRGQENERAAMLQALGALYSIGRNPNWSSLYPSGGEGICLPSYPWQRTRFWLDLGASDASLEAPAPAGGDPGGRGLRGTQILLAHAADHLYWEAELAGRIFAYLGEEETDRPLILPSMTQMAVAIRAATELFGAAPHTLAEVEFEASLSVPRNGVRRVQVVLSPPRNQEMSFSLYSLGGDDDRSSVIWTRHATGKIRQPPAPV